MSTGSRLLLAAAAALCCLFAARCAQHVDAADSDAAPSRRSCDDKKYASAWPPRDVFLRLAGDTPPIAGAKRREEITIGAMIKVHEHSSVGLCGPISPMGVLEVEMLIHTVERLNVDGQLPFSIGLLVKDDCGNASYALEESLEFVKGFITSILKVDRGVGDQCGPGTMDGRGGSSQKPPYIAAVIGATGSSSSIQMSNLLKLFKIPQIGYWTTNSELTNKRYYKYYLRTIPNEDDFLEIIGKVVVSLHWTYVSIVYEDFPLSKQSQSTMEAILRKLEVCVALSLAIKPSDINSTAAYENVINKLSSTPARGVILITSETTTLVTMLMQAVRNLNATGKFVWLGNRDWSRSPEISDAYTRELEGAITVEPFQRPVSGFADHLKQLSPLSYNKNPWFREWWETKFLCKFDEGHSHWSPHTCSYQGTQCSAMNSSYANVDNLVSSHASILSRLQLIHDAVMAVAFGLQLMHAKKCDGISKTTLCSYMNTTVMNPARNEYLLELMQGNRFMDLSHTEFNFSEDGDGPRRFEVFNFQPGSNGRHLWKTVGSYTDDGGMKLDTASMRFAAGNAVVPISVCSKACLGNQAKMVMDNQPCCWSCIDCNEYERLVNGTCQMCPRGSKPSHNKTSCDEIPPAYLTYSHPVSVGALSLAMLGIAATVAVGVLFVVKRDTPVVRAAGREMTFVLLGGILLCYLTAFVIASEPTDVTCVLQNTVPGVSFTICYAAILLKANRIYRIFNSGRRSTRRPRCVSPLSTVLLCAGIVFVQLLITTLWIIARQPRAGLWHPSRTSSYLVCLTPASEPERSHMVAFAFPIALLLVCIVHAILTRKIPGAFNESKLIGFTVYTTCIIWLAFVPLYTTAGDDIPIMLATECFSIMLSATVSLACVFFPKAYIILFRAEKNIRPRGGTSFRSKASFRTANNSFATEPESLTSSGYHTLGKEASTDKSSADAADSPKGTTPVRLAESSAAGSPPAVFFSGRSTSKRARIHLPADNHHSERVEVANCDFSNERAEPPANKTAAAARLAGAVKTAGGVPSDAVPFGASAAPLSVMDGDAQSKAAPTPATHGPAMQPAPTRGERRPGTKPAPVPLEGAAKSPPIRRSDIYATAASPPSPRSPVLLTIPQPGDRALNNRRTAVEDSTAAPGSGATEAPGARRQRTMYDVLLNLQEKKPMPPPTPKKAGSKSDASINNNKINALGSSVENSRLSAS